MSHGQPGLTYTPTSLSGKTLEELARQVFEELLALSGAYNRGLAREVEMLHVAPPKPRDGVIVGADGTDWNPGSGAGIYAYYSGAWHKLG